MVLFLLALLVQPILSASADDIPQNGFKDIKHHWAADEIRKLHEMGVLKGFEDGTFKPDKYITRAEFVTVIVRALQLEMTSTTGFADVPDRHWALGAISAGVRQGLLHGYPDGTFRPNYFITRAESAAILTRSYRYEVDENIGPRFPDVTPYHWAYQNINTLANNGIIEGNPAGMFEPDRFVTRAEFAVMLWRTIEKGVLPVTKPLPELGKEYTLELERWGVYNDGTHPAETTKGFNDALQWASANGYTTFKVPAGTYLIKKGPETDPTAQINIPSNMTFWMDDNTVLQKETNGFEFYRLLYVGPMVENVTIKGGTLIGDRDTHDYSTKQYPYTANTHEAGFGIMSDGARYLTIDGVEIKNFTGDGILIGNASGWVSGFWDEDVEQGAIDSQGNLIDDPAKIRTKKSVKNDFENAPRAHFFERGFVMFTEDEGVDENAGYDVYFYKKDGTFIQSVKGARYHLDEVPIPEGAGYFLAVFTPKPADRVSVTLNLQTLSKYVTVKNSKIHDNRRQGISVVGAHHVTIENNEIFNIQGTAPQSAIDFEVGRSILNYDFKVLNNRFYDNKSYHVVLFDGSKAIIEGNYFGKSNIGLAGSYFTDSIVRNNTFENSGISIQSNGHVIENNHITKGDVNLRASNIKVDGLTLIDSQIQVQAGEPFGIELQNIDSTHHEVVQTGLLIKNNPIRAIDITITGAPKMDALSGGVEGSIFENLTLIDYHPSNKYPLSLPMGTYNNCTFETGTNEGSTQITTRGVWEFNNCQFIVSRNALLVNHVDADVTINHSTFDIHENLAQTGTAIQFWKAKRIQLLDSEITATSITATDLRYMALIRLNRLHGKQDPFTVAEAIIQGNIIRSNTAVIGLNTEDAGVGAPPYLIKDNTFYKAVMKLKANDINENNSVDP